MKSESGASMVKASSTKLKEAMVWSRNMQTKMADILYTTTGSTIHQRLLCLFETTRKAPSPRYALSDAVGYYSISLSLSISITDYSD